ncbi:MAG: ATP-binding protein, partial [Oscillospiraceae bacterium]
QGRNDKNIDGSIVVEKIPAVIDNFGKVHPDDLHLLMEMHEKITAGEPRATCVARWKDEKTDEFWWIEIIYTTIYDERGNPVKAVGSSTNVTKQIELENQYYEEVSNMEQMNKENVTSLRINLTKDSIDERSELNGIKLGKKSEVTFNNCFEKIVENIPNKKQRQMFAKTFSKENLMNNFSKGNEKITLEYQSRFPNGEIKWVSTTVNIYKNPITGDIELFSYTKDINAQKMAQMIIDSVVRNDYDFIADFDALNDRYIMCSIDEGAKDAPLIEGVFSKTLKKYIDNKVSEEYRELFFEQIKPKNMEKKLKKEDAFFFNYKTNDKPEPKIKMVKIFYIDKNTKHICIARTDVTKIVKEQEQRNDLLNSALQAAKQANSAKSDFLSRMSHEIRTPMNAIIGMSSIAAQAVGDDEQIADCIAKIGISSRFLLSLINDILDMSRIESGKVLLKSEKIPFEDFLHEINAICYSNAKAKGIDYENIVDNRIDEYYLGDATKLQQILINILSNAIKFTAGGGKVSLNVYQVKKDKENATIRFVINDTGCGINQKFVSKIFEPFEQEYGGTTTMYGGTGLGLAISKNLVELMDGKISVRSIVGVGSEFT